MNEIELSKKALKSIDGQDFSCKLYAVDKTGKRFYEADRDFDLSSKEIRAILKDRWVDTDILFEGLKVKDGFKLTDRYAELVHEDGGLLEVQIKDVVPRELKQIAAELDEVDEDEENEVEAMRQKLYGINDGNYTFLVDLEGDDGVISSDLSVQIFLTKDEALGILYAENGSDEIFDEICDEEFEEDELMEKINEEGCLEKLGVVTYGAESPRFEQYLQGWDYIITNILTGNIKKDQLDEWLDYFYDVDYWDMGIEAWHAKEYADEDEDDDEDDD